MCLYIFKSTNVDPTQTLCSLFLRVLHSKPFAPQLFVTHTGCHTERALMDSMVNTWSGSTTSPWPKRRFTALLAMSPESAGQLPMLLTQKSYKAVENFTLAEPQPKKTPSLDKVFIPPCP